MSHREAGTTFISFGARKCERRMGYCWLVRPCYFDLCFNLLARMPADQVPTQSTLVGKVGVHMTRQMDETQSNWCRFEHFVLDWRIM